MNWLLRRKLHHVLFWTAYFIFWTSFSLYNYPVQLPDTMLITLIWLSGQSGVCYLFVYLLIPRFLNRKRFFPFILFTLTGLLVSALFIALCNNYLLLKIATNYSLPLKSLFLYVLLANFYTVFLFTAIKTFRDRIKSEKRNRKLEKEKTENELKFLKSQINPHFLFNAINSIYILIKKDPDLAASTLARFADMLRYQLYECNTDLISIERELRYLNNYIELERIRKGKTLEVKQQVDNTVKEFLIAPLLIMPLIENAFKYVSVFPDKTNYINIDILYKSRIFEVQLENTVDDQAEISDLNPDGGIGLENLRRRLQLIYPDKHSLEISTDHHHYTALLTISDL